MKTIGCTILITLLSFSCIDPLDIQNNVDNRKLVVFGYIHNGESPYTVEVTRSQVYNGELNIINSISGALITLHEDGGATEELKETSPGIYETCEERIQGTPGKEYWITVLVPQTGESYTSVPELMPLPVKINDLTAKPGQKQMLSENGGLINRDGFYLDISFEEDTERESQYLIKYAGTYQVETYPEDAMTGKGGHIFVPNPEPCSGHIYDAEADSVIQVAACECCDCWIKENFSDPVLYEDRGKNASSVQNLEVTFVPGGFENQRAGFKYWVGAELRSMTRGSWEYWERLLEQKNANGSIFQPQVASIPGNIISEADSTLALGYFYAASRDFEGFDGVELIYMTEADPVQDFSCLRIKNSVTSKPDYYPF